MEKIKEIENLKKQRAKMRQKQFEKDQKLVSMSNGMHDEADDEEKLRLTRNSFKTECLEDIKGQQQVCFSTDDITYSKKQSVACFNYYIMMVIVIINLIECLFMS